MSGYPAAYLRWQARDLLRGAGVATAAIAGFFCLMIWRMPGAAATAGGGALLAGFLDQVTWPLALVATGEMVRRDRNEGYHRFYFSRPVHPALFYLARWLLGLALVLAAAVAMAVAVLARSGEFLLGPGQVGRVGLTYLLVGGTVFLVSTAATGGPRDWLAALLVHVYQNTVADLLATGVDLWPALRWLHAALPPMHFLGPGLDPRAALHAGLYGAAMVGAALLLLDRRPLGGGARD